MNIHCDFSEPVKNDGVPPNLVSQNWEFSKMNCSVSDFPTSSTSTLPEYISKIISTSTPEKSFYLSKTMDIGQVLMLSFFVVFCAFAVVFFIFSIKNIISKKF